jgi:hypothetical protein
MTDHDELATQIRSALAINPTMTVNLLASQLETTVQDVAFVLDEFFCHEKSIEHVGPGQGGGWIDEEIRAELVKPEEPLFIGYRWPDGSVNTTTPFDITNDEHRSAVGLPPISDEE